MAWILETVAIKDLKENPKNPRYITKDASKRLESLMKKFGLIDKPVVNKDYTLIGGHQRLAILKKMKVKSVECWVSDTLIEDKELDELCIGLNQGGDWDFDILANQYDFADLLNMGFSEEMLLGHSDDAELIESQEEKPKKKSKECPNCGHQI